MYKKISEGDVVFYGEEYGAVGGSRIAQLPDGRLACTFNVNETVESNSYHTLITYSDDGENWTEPRIALPYLHEKKAHFTSIRNTLDGRVCIAGMLYPNFDKNQKWWSNEKCGIIENGLIIAFSDDGYDFSEYIEVPLPFYGACENPGGALVDKDGTIYILYSPYRTVEGKDETDVNRLIITKSRDGGKTWESVILGEVAGECQYGEAWIVRLCDDMHMVSAWQTATKVDADKYFLSHDGGESFEGPFNLPFNGQSTALEAIGDGKVLVIYNLRNVEKAGVYMALAKPDKNGFNMIANESVWLCERKTKSGSGGEFDQWTDFAFGEPHVKKLSDGTFIATLWYDNGEKKGIRYVRLALED